MARSHGIFVHILVFVILLNALVVVSGAVLHELGHAMIGWTVGCTDIQILLFDSGFAATRMACPSTVDGAVLALGSFLLVIPVASLFLLLQAFPEYSIGWILIGVHLLGSTGDLYRTAMPDAAVMYGVPLLGALIILHGENQLIAGLLDANTPEPHAAKKPYPGQRYSE